MGPIMNWQKEASGNNPVYPSGTYKIQCTDFERIKASTGTSQIRWKAKIILPEAHAGRTIVDHTALTEKALWRVANMIGGFGIDLSQLSSMSTDPGEFDAICKFCLGRTAFWRNEESINPNTGAPRNNIVEYIRDQDQEVITPRLEDEAPDFVK